jgi:hypothetical protein
MKTEVVRQLPNIKSHENPFSSSRLVTYIQADGLTLPSDMNALKNREKKPIHKTDNTVHPRKNYWPRQFQHHLSYGVITNDLYTFKNSKKSTSAQ